MGRKHTLDIVSLGHSFGKIEQRANPKKRLEDGGQKRARSRTRTPTPNSF